MAITIADFRTRFPEFCDRTLYPDARIQLFIDDTVCWMGTDENHWCSSGQKYNYAQAYLTAHLLTKGTNSSAGDSSGAAGPITSKTAGGVSVTRSSIDTSNMSTTDADFSSTTYGQRYMEIRDQCFIGMLPAVSGGIYGC